jgi:hypothetical protein
MESVLCPICGREMEAGWVAVRKYIAARLRWPFYSDRLVFRGQGQTERTETVIREGRRFQAFKCLACEVFLVTRQRWESKG